MKRLIAITAVVVAAVALVVFGTASGDDGGYRVRAIFDNAAFVIPGMDVRIAGVVVGSIESIDLTADKKAAVVLKIDDPNYQNFKTDATCTIRPQSLIGERFIECSPQKPGPEGKAAAELSVVKSGPGEGQYLLPATNTARSVDLDLINNIMRLPFRERFTIFLNEFGTGLAGNGRALSAALKKSDPALQAFDDVLAILASQNRTLAELAKNGDTVLKPLARERLQIQGFIRNSGETAQATAERSANFQEMWRRFPAFLEQLGPTMDELGNFAQAFTPVVQDLHGAAPSLNTFVTGTPEFSKNATASLVSLGQTAKTGGPALQASLPFLQDLGALTTQTQPLTTNLAALLRGFSYQDGVNSLMKTIFAVGTSTNGFDQYGHYGRARLVVGTCQTYVTTPQPACLSSFSKDFGATTASPAAPSSFVPGQPSSASSSTAPASAAAAPAPKGASAAASRAIAPPKTLLPGDAPKRSRKASRGAATSPGSGAPADQQSATSLLDYLLGQ